MLFSRHSGWVKMEAQVVMAVLILSWAKLFQRESKALPHCWRRCLTTIFPFVSSRSNPTLYFSFLSLYLSSLSPTLKFIYALFPPLRAYLSFPSVCLRCLLPSFLPFFLSISPSPPHLLSILSFPSFFFFPITVFRLDSCRSAVPGGFFRDHVGCRWRMFGWVVLESHVNRATVCLHLCFISAHYNAHLVC